MITTIGDLLIVATALLAAACVAAYQWVSRSAWLDSDTGRHLMSFMASITVVSGLSATRAVVVDVLHQPDPAWFRGARLVAFVSVPAVLAWRLALILSARRPEPDPSSTSGAAMPSVPRLPAVLVAALGVIASMLAIVQPSLPEPWPAVVGGVLAVLTLLGVPVTVRAVRAHGRATYAWRAQQEQLGQQMRTFDGPVHRTEDGR